MTRLSISEFSTYRWSLEQEINELTRRGINNIGIWRTKFSDLDSDIAADMLYSNDLHVSSLSWAGGFTGSCGMSHEQAIDDGVLAIRTAAQIGADCLIVHPGNRGGHTRKHARRLFESAIKRLLPVANDFGVKLAMELMCRTESADWTVFESFQQAIDFAAQYRAPQLGMVLDIYHVGCDTTVFENLRQLIPRLALVQLSDRVNHQQRPCRCQPGEGSIPLQTWFNELENLGYSGKYEIEVHGPLLGEERYRQMLDHSISSFVRLHDERLRATSSSAT
ncbi:MAG: sugar phosphate isomerase/epimerase family protein [Pirellulaceae bacterium]